RGHRDVAPRRGGRLRPRGDRRRARGPPAAPAVSRRAPPASRRSSPTVRATRRSWDREAAAYERRNRRSLRVGGGASWGLLRIPESELRLLGDVRGVRTLELGCGSGLWSIALGRRGARPVGFDLSAVRVRQAWATMAATGVRFGLVQANAERLPFRD